MHKINTMMSRPDNRVHSILFMIKYFIDFLKKKYFLSHLEIVKVVTKEILRRNLIQTR